MVRAPNRVPFRAMREASGRTTSRRNCSGSTRSNRTVWPTKPLAREPPETDAIDVTTRLAPASTR